MHNVGDFCIFNFFRLEKKQIGEYLGEKKIFIESVNQKKRERKKNKTCRTSQTKVGNTSTKKEKYA